MLTQDRYRAILDLLEEKNSVTVSELTKLLDSIRVNNKKRPFRS